MTQAELRLAKLRTVPGPAGCRVRNALRLGCRCTAGDGEGQEWASLDILSNSAGDLPTPIQCPL